MLTRVFKTVKNTLKTRINCVSKCWSTHAGIRSSRAGGTPRHRWAGGTVRGTYEMHHVVFIVLWVDKARERSRCAGGRKRRWWRRHQQITETKQERERKKGLEWKWLEFRQCSSFVGDTHHIGYCFPDCLFHFPHRWKCLRATAKLLLRMWTTDYICLLHGHQSLTPFEATEIPKVKKLLTHNFPRD